MGEEIGIKAISNQEFLAQGGKSAMVVSFENFAIDLQLAIYLQVKSLFLLPQFILAYGLAFKRTEFLISPSQKGSIANGAFSRFTHISSILYD